MTVETAMYVERRLAPRCGAAAGVLLAAMGGMGLLNMTAWLESFLWRLQWGPAWVRLLNAAAATVLAGGCVVLMPLWTRAVARGAVAAEALGLVAAMAYSLVAALVWLVATAQLMDRSAGMEAAMLVLAAAMSAVLAAVTGWWMILVMMERGRELALVESQAGALRLADCVTWSCGWYAVGMVGTLWVVEMVGSGAEWGTRPAWHREMVGMVEGGWPGMAGPLVAGLVALGAFGLTRRRGGWRRVAWSTGWLSAVVWGLVMGGVVGVWVWRMWTL
jgi:hypothetical protein